MKSTLYVITFIIIPLFGLAQQTLDFNYFRRSGKVDVKYYIKNDQGKTNLPQQSEFILDNTSEEQYFIIELSNLRLGLDKNTAELKQGKDINNYMLHVPVDPASITLSTEALQFKSISNDGLLAETKTTKANKKIEIHYYFQNTSAEELKSEIQLLFKIEAVEGARPLKEEHKGGDIIKCNLTVKPNEKRQQYLEFSKAENKLYSHFKKSTETAYKIKFAREYLSTYPSINEERVEELRTFLVSVKQFIDPVDHDKKIYAQIVKFCVQEKEHNRCETLCAQYQDFVWDQPKNYKGTYLEKAYVYRIKLFSDNPNQQWLSLCEKFEDKYPSSRDRYAINAMMEDYLQTIEDQKNKLNPSFQSSNFRTTNSYSESNKKEEEIEEIPELIEEEEIILAKKEDWCTIYFQEDNSDVILRTGGFSSEGYVVEFKDIADQRIKYNPSFVGEKESIKLDDVLEGKFKAGKYKVSVFSKIDRKLLDTSTIEYSSTKLPPELKYILMVSCIALGFVSYKKYLKL